MLSNTSGLRSRNVAKGMERHRSTVTFSTTLCPHLAKGKEKCPQLVFEQNLRREIMNAKERELRMQATELLVLEHDGGELDNGIPFTPSQSDIAQVVHVMKQEKAYMDWSLDREVAKRMLELKRRSCPYTHLMMTGSVPVASPQDSGPSEVVVVGAGKAVPPALAWTVRRCAEVLCTFSVFQKLAALVMIMGSVVVPCGIVADVERLLRDKHDLMMMRRRRNAAAPEQRDDDDYEPDAAEIEAEGARLVRVSIINPGKASLNLGSLPSIMSYIAQHIDLVLANTLVDREASASTSAEAAAVAPNSDDDAAVWNDVYLRSNERSAASGGVNPTADTHLRALLREAASITPKARDVSDASSLRQFLSALGVPKLVAEKELDLSSPSRCQELLDVVRIVWKQWIPFTQRDQAGAVSAAAPLRFLSLRRSALSTAEHFVALLRKHQLHEHLVGLDMSSNKLDSLRFLFQLRADFSDRLLFLWLQENPITRKPEYREQVRATLPRLVCLDGCSIRRPPLALPYPRAPHMPRNVDPAEYGEVLAVVDRFLYAWETQQVPLPPVAFAPRDRKLDHHPAVSAAAHSRRKRLRNGGAAHPDAPSGAEAEDDDEQMFRLCSSFSVSSQRARKSKASPGGTKNDEGGDSAGSGSSDDEGEEEELDENNFAKRYMHPECVFSLVTSPGCTWFDPTHTVSLTEIDANAVEAARCGGHDDGSHLVVLSKQDINELRVMDVSIRNHHRNLILGKPALYRVVKGPVNCFTAYRSTLYPERMMVDHHLDAAVSQVSLVGDEDMRELAAQEAAALPPTVPDSSSTKQQKKKAAARDPYAAKTISGRNAGPLPAPGMQQNQLFQGSAFSPSSRKPLAFLVTLHGCMSWRCPTMTTSQATTMLYDRTITVVHRPMPQRGALPPRTLHKIPRFVVASDMVSLRPLCSTTTPGSCFARRSGTGMLPPLFEARARDRLEPVAVEFGLDDASCADNRAFVNAVAERSTSDAALHKVLSTLLRVRSSGSTTEEGESELPSPSCAAFKEHEIKRSASARGTGVDQRGVERRTSFAVRPAFSAFDVIEFASTAVDTSSSSTTTSSCQTNAGGPGVGGADAATFCIPMQDLDSALAEANAFSTTSFSPFQPTTERRGE